MILNWNWVIIFIPFYALMVFVCFYIIAIIALAYLSWKDFTDYQRIGLIWLLIIFAGFNMVGQALVRAILAWCNK